MSMGVSSYWRSTEMRGTTVPLRHFTVAPAAPSLRSMAGGQRPLNRTTESVLPNRSCILDGTEVSRRDYKAFPLYTPSTQVRQLSATAAWINRPLLTDYYRKMGGAIGAAGTELNENFLAVTSRTDTTSHWTRDVSIKGLPTLWSSVGWIPFYAENPDAGSDRFRGGYLYAEVMGPWGNLRIKDIDGEPVGAEIGMTVQLFNTAYPFHYHHPQEIYMTLTKPSASTRTSTW
jgi:hypothetical protein